jgi:ribosomal protein L21
MTRTRQFALVTASAVLAIAASLSAQAPKPVTESVTVTATIEAIDRGNRLVTLKGEKGNLVTVQVGEEMKRFDELKVGDKVSATYMESVAVVVRQPGQPAPTSGSGPAVTRSTGAPGATAAVQDTITVTVVSVDKANQAVTVKRKDGSDVSMRVENPKYLEAVKAGDTVDITYTRALMVSVAPIK